MSSAAGKEEEVKKDESNCIILKFYFNVVFICSHIVAEMVVALAVAVAVPGAGCYLFVDCGFMVMTVGLVFLRHIYLFFCCLEPSLFTFYFGLNCCAQRRGFSSWVKLSSVEMRWVQLD